MVFGVDFGFNFLWSRVASCSIGDRRRCFCRGLRFDFVIYSHTFSCFLTYSWGWLVCHFWFYLLYSFWPKISHFRFICKWMKRFSVRSSLHRLVHQLHENLPTFSSTLFLRQFGKCSYSSLNELFRIYLPSITALRVSLKYKHRTRDSFPALHIRLHIQMLWCCCNIY